MDWVLSCCLPTAPWTLCLATKQAKWDHCVVSILRVFNDNAGQFGSNAKAYGARHKGGETSNPQEIRPGTQLSAREIARIHVWETAVPRRTALARVPFRDQRARDASSAPRIESELDSRLVCSHAALAVPAGDQIALLISGSALPECVTLPSIPLEGSLPFCSRTSASGAGPTVWRPHSGPAPPDAEIELSSFLIRLAIAFIMSVSQSLR